MKALVLGLLGVFSVSAFGAEAQQLTRKQAVALTKKVCASKELTCINVTAPKIRQEFETNGYAARQKYGSGSTAIFINGVISKSGESHRGKPQVFLKAGRYHTIVAEMGPDMAPQMVGMQKGRRVTLLCEFEDDSIILRFKSCARTRGNTFQPWRHTK